MSESDVVFNLDDAHQTLDVLAEHVEQFVAAWKTGTPPSLSPFLPKTGAVRRLVLCELIKVDLEYRFEEHNLPKRLAEYVQEFPELNDGGVPAELVYEEFHIRRRCGFAVDPGEYLAAYPEQADELRRLLDLDRPYDSTSLSGRSEGGWDELDAGDEIDDFHLLLRLGRGAFASVFLARQESMQRLVALKVSADCGAEPQTLAQLDHDHIVRVFDQRSEPDRGLRLLYMQYVPGGTLQDVVRAVRATPPAQRDGRLLLRTIDRALEDRGESRPVESGLREKLASMTWPQVVCWIGSRLARALEYAHRRDVLHCDVKPANVLLTAEGAPKLADFNVSLDVKLPATAASAYFGGSLVYMSPEQLEATNPAHERAPKSLDGRSDQYSLGVVLWELLTGRRPFDDGLVRGNWSDTLDEMATQRGWGVADAKWKRLPDDCPLGLRRVLGRCLSPFPEDRFPTAGDLAQHLELCLHPRAERILFPRSTWLRRYVIAAVFLLAAVPNVLAGVFNFFYNRTYVVGLGPAQETFWHIQAVINAIAYPLGLGLLVALTLPIARAAARSLQQSSEEEHSASNARTRCLRLGHNAALIGVCEWAVAGIAYPASIHAAMGSVPLVDYLHFLGSLLLCGLIAAAYPYFGITCFCLRVAYPALVQNELARWNDGPALERLDVLAIRYLGMAASVPLLGVAALTAMDLDARIALGILSTGGLLGFGVLYWLFRELQADAAALTHALGQD